MQRPPSLVISREDYQKISNLLAASESDLTELLEEEIGRAQLVPAEELPADRVAMNSVVSFKDLDSNKEQEVTLVYPHEASIEEGRVSILAPVGSALIGLNVGQVIEWAMGEDKIRRIQVTAVRDRGGD